MIFTITYNAKYFLRNIKLLDDIVEIQIIRHNFVKLYTFISFRMIWGGVIEGCITEQSEFLKNVSLNKFRKVAYIEWVLDFFRYIMHTYAIESSTLTKLGDFSLKYRNFSNFLATVAPKICHLTQIFPKSFKSPHFSTPSAPKNVSLYSKSHLLPFWVVTPSIWSLVFWVCYLAG